ncbi:protein MpFAD4 [Marchantia polymorpha subsp. ruderalis]|uniref:Cytochrome b5 heme-binding domain-containing protein n=2 Tax=Marchantia polymorpha TaxID=3197 RepID=A0AAF6AXW5_MARPO|nr:hypothetical protein MARPO_0006s0074 [Marchantia polymorpha]BBN04599.1 hypothetical protein Mp_3g06040 [Marchantia polymorpha subsp. ruderalis]|eukprot:PTQ48035.1 hypothetical protein MARPO_0006s0074 [Marchantia polymorpha]
MATAAKDRLVTKIHDKWYDLTDFEKIHPGGPVALGLASGRDGTVMFESHHPFTHRKILDAILQKYELDEESSRHLKTLEEQHGIAEHRFNWKSEFGDALKFHVKEYFEAEAKRRNVSLVAATKAPPERWFEIAVLGVIFFATLVSFIRGDWISLFTCPLGVWVFGVNTFHDAAHFALHKNWRVNCTVPYLFPHFSSPFVWYHQHNIGHHSYPNVAHRDPDLVHHYWMKREHKSVKWLPAHEKQRNLSFLVFWWTVAVEFGLATMEDLWMVMYNVYNESVPMKVISKKRLLCHVIGRVFTIGGIHVWPFFVFDTWTRSIIFATIPYLWFSFLFMMNTQINHLTPETAHEADQDWYKHQVITAQDFGVASRFCFLMSGGLNYQVVHHLFPTVNHCHLVKLQPIVARLCEKHGVEYKQVAGYAAAIKAHHAHTVNMSFKDNEN